MLMLATLMSGIRLTESHNITSMLELPTAKSTTNNYNCDMKDVYGYN